MDQNTIFEGKTAAAFSYITFVGLIIAYFMNNEVKNPFAAFHIRQSLGLTVSYFLIMIPLSMLDIPMASLGFFIVFFVLWLYGIISAFSRTYTTYSISRCIISESVYEKLVLYIRS